MRHGSSITYQASPSPQHQLLVEQHDMAAAAAGHCQQRHVDIGYVQPLDAQAGHIAAQRAPLGCQTRHTLPDPLDDLLALLVGVWHSTPYSFRYDRWRYDTTSRAVTSDE